MPPRRRFFLALALALGVCLVSGPALAGTGDPFLVSTSIKPPLSTAEGNGFLDVLCRELLHRVGREAQLVRMPAERAMQSVSDGVSDAELPRVAGLEKTYPGLVMVPEKILDYEFTAFARQGGVAVRGWESLAGLRLGAITGWKIYEQNIPPGGNVTWVADADLLFGLLERGRVDLVLHEHFAGSYFARRLGLADVRELAPPLSVQPMYLYVNRRHEGLVPALADALRAMKADGTYERILHETTGQ